jgi:hypothetical protein
MTHSASTIQVPCGCIFEAEGEMNMVQYCPECEAALQGLKPDCCPDCCYQSEMPEELDAHLVEVHMGIVLRPLTFVIPPVSAGLSLAG